MSDFEASGSVTLKLDNLDAVGDDIEAEVERSFGSVTMGSNGNSGSGGRGQRRTRQMLRSAETQADELTDQTELLKELVDEVGDGGGGLGGGGGGGGDGSGDSILTGGIGGIASRVLGGGALASAAPILGGAALGLGGVRVMEELGVNDAARNAGQQAGNIPGAGMVETAASSLFTTQMGAAGLDLAQGDLSFSNLRELNQPSQNRPSVDLGMRIGNAIQQGFTGLDFPGGGSSANQQPGQIGDLPETRPEGEQRFQRESSLFFDADPIDGRRRFRNRKKSVTDLSGSERRAFAGVSSRSAKSVTDLTGQERQAFAGSGGSEVNVDAPLSVRVDAVNPQEIDSQLDRRFQEFRRQILQEIRQETPSRLQTDFQRKTP